MTPQEEIARLRAELAAAEKYLQLANHNLYLALEENKSLQRKLDKFVSCCCAGCARHNLFLKEGENGKSL